MSKARNRAGLGLLAWLCVLPCDAQESPAPTHAPPVETFPTPPQTPPVYCGLPEGTPLVLEIIDPISSARVKRGDTFRLRVRDAVSKEGVVVLAAGTGAVGEVVHAESSRGGGKPGELILAARRLQLGDREIKLRGFKLGGAGNDTSHVALGASFGIGPFAHFIHGKEIELPALTTGIAKLAEPLCSPLLPDASAPPDQPGPSPTGPASSPTPTDTPPKHLE